MIAKIEANSSSAAIVRCASPFLAQSHGASSDVISPANHLAVAGGQGVQRVSHGGGQLSALGVGAQTCADLFEQRKTRVFVQRPQLLADGAVGAAEFGGGQIDGAQAGDRLEGAQGRQGWQWVAHGGSYSEIFSLISRLLLDFHEGF